MGQTSREDLRPAFSRGHPENHGEYVHIGEDNPNEAGKDQCRQETSHSYYYKVIIRTGVLEQLENITEELVDYFGSAEPDRKYGCYIKGS